MGAEESRALGLRGGGRQTSELNDLMTHLLLAAAASSLSRGSGSGSRGQFTWDRTDCSSNMEVIDSGRKVRKKGQQNRTDMVRARQGFKMGLHTWKITWPKHMRGQHAVIGLATTRAPLSCSGYSALLGSNDQSVGWDIVTNKGLYNDCVISDYPDNKPADYQVGETIVVVADMNDGTLSFFDGEEHLGLCLSGLKVFARNNQALYPAVSITWEGAVVTLRMCDDADADSDGEAEGEFTMLPALDSPINSSVGDRLRSASSSSLASASSATSLSQKRLYFVNEDKSLQLTNDNMTASVISGRRGGRFLLSSRPLDSDEMFQVRLDQVTTGVADSMLMHFGLIDFKSKRNEEQMWTIVSSHILFNGEEKYAFPNLNFDILQQGQRIGFIRRSDGQLDIYIDGKLKVKCRLSIPSSHAYVCLEGRAQQVSLVIENSRDEKDAEVREEEQALQKEDEDARKEMADRAAEIGQGIEHVLALMSDSQPEDVSKVTAAFHERVTLVRQKLFNPQHQRIFSDKLAEIGGGIIMTDYLQFLYSLGLADDTVYKCYFDILYELMGLTFHSRLLTIALAENGMFDLLNKQIAYLTNRLTDDQQKLATLLCQCLGIIGNCAKHSENRQHIEKSRLDETLCFFLFRTKNAENILLYCYLSIMIIIPPETIEKLTINLAALSNLIMLLKISSTAKDYMISYTFPRLNTTVSIACYECVLAVTALAHNAAARAEMGANNVFTHLTKFATSSSDPYHQELVLLAIHALLTRDTVHQALQCRELSPLVDRLEKSRTDGVKQEAKRVSDKIKSLKAPSPLKPMGTQVLPVPRTTKKDCAFAKLCQRFIVWMKLADDFFDKTHDACCCTDCFEDDSSASASHYLRGKPPKRYGPPIGWFRCGLQIPPRAKACKAFDNYHRAYHGTTVDVVENILKEGSLLLPGDEALGGKKIRVRDGHFTDDRRPAGFDINKIYLSPSIRYAAHYAYALPKRITVDGKAYTAQVVFQVLVEPGSYTVGKQTVGATSQLDPRFSNEELEWSTKQRGAVILYGLLCRLQSC